MTIEADAFGWCTELREIEMPVSLISIGDGAFRRCTKLTNIIIPKGTTTIGNACFFDTYGLKTISLPSSLKKIGNTAFGYTTTIIYFEGTIYQWSEVNKTGWETYWSGTGIIHCSDGCVDLNDKQITCPTHGTAGTQVLQ